MTDVTEQIVLEALKGVQHPKAGQDIVSLGLVQGVLVRGDTVSFILELPPQDKDVAESLQTAAKDKLMSLDGVENFSIVITAERKPPEMQAGAQTGAKAAGPPPKAPVPGVKSIIAVASGKGGVGKSTVAVNLALALKKLGLSVGLLDADIYGPSAPRLLGINKRPKGDENHIEPLKAQGLQVISMGFMVDEEAPLIWRGPMVGSAVKQFLYDVSWKNLDVLVVDMPPGTGDAQLTLAQRVPLAGAVIVSTPQDLALIDARKGLEMFRAINVPILGVIENMSTFICPHCGEESHIFSHGGARKTAETLDVPFLGEIPLNMVIREASDGGKPIVKAAPRSPEAKAFLAIAEKIKPALKVK